MIDRRRLLPASLVCFALFIAGLLVLAFADTKRPVTRSAIEELAHWSGELARTNNRLADSVIATQQAGALTVEQAKTILLKDVAIAQAGQQTANQLAAARKCALDLAGKNASPAKIDAAARKCLEISRGALSKEAAAVRAAIGDVKQSLTAVKDPAKKARLFRMVETIDELEERISRALKNEGVTP